MYRVRLSRHAKRRMIERRASLVDVVETLNKPFQLIYDRWRDVYIAVNSRGYAVVYAYRGEVVEVLTVMGRREYEALVSKHGFKRYKIIY